MWDLRACERPYLFVFVDVGRARARVFFSIRNNNNKLEDDLGEDGSSWTANLAQLALQIAFALIALWARIEKNTE